MLTETGGCSSACRVLHDLIISATTSSNTYWSRLRRLLWV